MKISKKQGNNSWDNIISFRSGKEQIRHEAQMLMFRFLSEVELLYDPKEHKRKDLAKKIKTPADYLTKVFRGNKPLSFETIAKIQKKFTVRFYVKAYKNDELLMSSIGSSGNQFSNNPFVEIPIDVSKANIVVDTNHPEPVIIFRITKEQPHATSL